MYFWSDMFGSYVWKYKIDLCHALFVQESIMV
jgi:hypothetical protein